MAALLNNTFLDHIQNNITKCVATIYTVIMVTYLPKVENILAPPRETELPSQAS